MHFELDTSLIITFYIHVNRLLFSSHRHGSINVVAAYFLPFHVNCNFVCDFKNGLIILNFYRNKPPTGGFMCV